MRRRYHDLAARALLILLALGSIFFIGNCIGNRKALLDDARVGEASHTADGKCLTEIAGRFLVEMLWKQAAFRQSDEKSREGAGSDPSYKNYKEKEKFYREHSYLSGLLEEGTGETLSKEPLSENAPRENPISGTPYVMEQLMDYDFLMKHLYNVHTSTTAGRELMNAKALLEKDLTMEKNPKTPQILIYHTHSQEAYRDSAPGQTVVGVGDALAALLEEKGYGVYHDRTVYDLRGGKLDRSRAYNYALEGLETILKENPTIEVVLDIHRDGVAENVHLAADVDGKETAKIMFFNGLSQTPEGPIEYLKNPYREENLAFSLKMQLEAAARYPGFTRKIYLKGLRYNEHVRPRAALIEVGAQTNTYEEAVNAMAPLADILDRVLQGNQNNSIIQ